VFAALDPDEFELAFVRLVLDECLETGFRCEHGSYQTTEKAHGLVERRVDSVRGFPSHLLI